MKKIYKALIGKSENQAENKQEQKTDCFKVYKTIY